MLLPSTTGFQKIILVQVFKSQKWNWEFFIDFAVQQNLFYYCHEIRNCPSLLAFEIEMPAIIEFHFYLQSLPHFESYWFCCWKFLIKLGWNRNNWNSYHHHYHTSHESTTNFVDFSMKKSNVCLSWLFLHILRILLR